MFLYWFSVWCGMFGDEMCCWNVNAVLIVQLTHEHQFVIHFIFFNLYFLEWSKRKSLLCSVNSIWIFIFWKAENEMQRSFIIYTYPVTLIRYELCNFSFIFFWLLAVYFCVQLLNYQFDETISFSWARDRIAPIDNDTKSTRYVITKINIYI